MSTSDYNSNGASIINRRDDRVYSDLDLGFIKHPVYNDIMPLKDIDAVKQSVRNLLLTNRGERLFRPNLGSGVFDLLFEHANLFTFQAVRDNIKDMLSINEPRISQIAVDIKDDSDKNAMAVKVKFNIVGVANNQSVDFYLERLR
jgi:phage baseplate assembly protein W